MPFKFLKAAQGTLTNRFNGNSDLLEAVAAGAMLVAYADGSTSDQEVSTAINAMKANQTLSAAFTTQQIERAVDTMYDRAKAGRSGRAGLYKEIDDVAGNPDHAEAVLWAVIDVADDDGISDVEMGVINNIAGRLKLDAKKFLAQA